MQEGFSESELLEVGEIEVILDIGHES